ncbi:excisionase family DNA-binding protein [Streptomyces sp. NBC_01558]|uniref:excisionase family DNA-binding protein n=1 Tax=Streptomyces sp. NBC_01558 TaxID=2975878 RepID=UPI002DDBC57C|nr:excisionase family DNA-binding protein [Streptomyces sp. NBC_01558]WSD78814.1 excisionase family DNA-binding protein [Streptomyces sp. NBC_01558]
MDEHATLPALGEDDTTLVLLTVEEAARRLRIGRTTCFALIRTGELESIPVGRLRRVPVDAPAAYVARQRAAHRAA